ncbi:sulfate/molybdate ABC transporter ATP-binding protein [Chelatococcus asaccharovorans]|mgnify:CR=1 FL=1|uniref:sulfate/molybdate ABC transporter ATP-binding protein n=1 Tax=Chelatococcus asaccharovorans TaxID=28210 RepID=UPI00224C7AEB|nr:sulfate/molybdate ABC transporter ATP-binding protein [Chelatococcus asaccharovorans]CAH1662558.1 Sulfate/thiosulfate import ATP-binding protein CysA [Chelatococcus asaccharovorans]CAH1683137.1 Sulfate/thiosulfate import ATP-binding protein CysA [Chelatococcus asaccharovorans]
MSIEIRNIFKQFGTTPVLKGVDLSIADGELIALLGASGSGKTTLLRILAGLDWPQSGEVFVDDTDWLRLNPQERQIGFVFQHYALFPHMSVFENVAFGLSIRPRETRPAKADIARRVVELLDLVQMGAYGSRYPAQLSGGQRQRVALARALAIQPKMLLLDEPFGALDARIRKDLRRWLRGLHERLGMTTIFVTHDQEEAFELADRVVVMGEGVIEQIGTPDDIYEQPASPFVARFLGGVNELPAELHAGHVHVAGADTSRVGRLALGDGQAMLFVRPHEIDLVPDATGTAVIKDIVPSGALIRYEVALPQTDKVIEVELAREAARDRTLTRGDVVRVNILRGRVFHPPKRQPVASASGRAGQAARTH